MSVRPRLIPVILIKNGLIVRSQSFSIHQAIGNPISTIHRLSGWNVDELILLDISTQGVHDLRRDDMQMRYAGQSTADLLRQIADVCFMPLAVGGRIRSIADLEVRLTAGADKCVINTQALDDPNFIGDAARRFGAQCIVVGIDVIRHDDGRHEVMVDGGKRATGLDPVAWAIEAESRGAGEIFLQSIDRDGLGIGYDVDLVQRVSDAVGIPVIACGGVGSYDDFPKAMGAGAAAAAAANIFHFFELSYPHAKQACLQSGVPMREVGLGSRWFPREPVYDLAERDRRIDERMARAVQGPQPTPPHPPVRYCTCCLYPSLSATPMEFDANGVCMGCRMAGQKHEVPPQEWQRRRDALAAILERHRCPKGSRHDCVIPVSGGKDSYFQTHVIKSLGFNPLLVTYYGNNYTEVGQRNLLRMKEAFGVDHIIYQPSVTTLKKLNRLGFVVMGDMNWHNHIGIYTLPMQMAAKFKIPLVIWGEHGYADLCGQYTLNDFVEWTYRNRLEHACRGYEWNYMVGREGLTAQDMACYHYPSDEEIFALGLRGLYLSNYTYWEANEHLKLMVDQYGFEVSDEPFDRTYRLGSNLDDMHENGLHDYLKYIKLGYGRCTDHASKDIRSGVMGRGQAIDLVRKHDPIKSSDLKRWLDYVSMTEAEFDAIADTFRDPRIWRYKDGNWEKDNLWDKPAP